MAYYTPQYTLYMIHNTIYSKLQEKNILLYLKLHIVTCKTALNVRTRSGLKISSNFQDLLVNARTDKA